jgi:hypothetical protein
MLRYGCMQSEVSVTIPASTADKLVAIGRAMLDLAQEIRNQADTKAHHGQVFPIPDLIPPAVISQDQAWFWTPEWQHDERQVNEEIRRGEYATFDSVETLLDDLHAQV